MAGRVTVQRDRGDTREHLLGTSECAGDIVIRRDLFASALKVKLLRPFAGATHRAIVAPVFRLVLVHDQFSVGKEFAAGFWISQAGGVVRMHMRQHHGIDVRGIDAGGFQVLLQLALFRLRIK